MASSKVETGALFTIQAPYAMPSLGTSPHRYRRPPCLERCENESKKEMLPSCRRNELVFPEPDRHGPSFIPSKYLICAFPSKDARSAVFRGLHYVYVRTGKKLLYFRAEGFIGVIAEYEKQGSQPCGTERKSRSARSGFCSRPAITTSGVI